MWGDYVLVADGANGLLVVDVSDPAMPSVAGSVDTPGSAEAIVLDGDLAYVAPAPTAGAGKELLG